LKELVYRLLKSHDEQKATQESQQKDLAATIEAQTNTIAKFKDKRTNSENLGLSFRRTNQAASRTAMPYTESHRRQTALVLLLRSSIKQYLREHY
jgi:hypothetical protein